MGPIPLQNPQFRILYLQITWNKNKMHCRGLDTIVEAADMSQST